MTHKTSSVRRPGQSSDDLPDADDYEIVVRGRAARELEAGARLTDLSPGDFAIDAIMMGAAMARWEALGYAVIARDATNREFILSPAIMGLNPPEALWSKHPDAR